MKNFLFFCLLFFIAHNCISQDLSDEKQIKSLKNVKFKSGNIKSKIYSILLNDETYLNIKYKVVHDGELNGSYSFVKMPSDFYFSTDRDFNYKFVLGNIGYWGETIGLNPDDIRLLKKKIENSKIEFSKRKVLIMIDFLKDYDECNLVFNNNENSIVCTLFFRRLL
ncbi:hypothetical protein ACDQ55_20200 [Chitinophaga sp. 30R24]|uniref:hypothetical protein n=1 Tax=Chitinophaga sp. 30R24 TaxID=3248838 RepID=UPI003B8EB801